MFRHLKKYPSRDTVLFPLKSLYSNVHVFPNVRPGTVLYNIVMVRAENVMKIFTMIYADPVIQTNHLGHFLLTHLVKVYADTYLYSYLIHSSFYSH
jgi:hypothetical protein